MKEFILAALMWLGLFTPPTAFTVTGYDPGGSVGTYLAFWDRIAKTGLTVVIDGACVSACTLVTAAVEPENICVTERASFGVHMASTDTGPDPEATALIERTFYPPWLQDWIAAWESVHGKLTEDVVYIEYADLSLHYRTCTAEEAPISGSP